MKNYELVMLVTKDFAHDLEYCFYQSHVAFTQQFMQKMRHGEFIKLSTGAMFFCDKDSFVSQVIGWGFAEDEDFETELKHIERFYYSQGHNRCDIELSPYVKPGLAEYLSQQGYLVTELTTISYLPMATYKKQKHDATVKLVDKDNASEWASAIAKAYDIPGAKRQLALYATAKNTYPFAAYNDDKEIVAGGVLAIYDDQCDLGFTATLNEYRGKGYQKALLIERLNLAKKQKAEMAIVATEPGSISEANVQKIGFIPAYTRIKFSKQL